MLLHPDRAQSLAHTVEADARVFAKFLLPGSDPRSALKGEPQVAHRVAWATMSLATVKRAGHTFDATVNDVVVAAVAGAVGRHLRDRGDEVDEVHALVPFNLRSLDQPPPPRPRQPVRSRPARPAGGGRGSDRAPARGPGTHERDQELARGRDQLRHPRSHRPHSAPRGGAPRELLRAKTAFAARSSSSPGARVAARRTVVA